MHQIDFDLNIDEISKIEGDAGLDLSVRDGKVVDVKFKIQEYKRFYTLGMRGKDATTVPQFVSRICGTCSNAHLLASIEAAEKALGIEVSQQTRLMKQLMINGLMIRDHALHLYVFALPDLFRKDSLIDFDENDPEQHQYLHDALDVKAVGNELQIYISGRSVHAPFAAVGGFMQIPDNSKNSKLVEKLESIRPAVLRLLMKFLEKIEPFERETTYMAIRGKDAWSFLEGEIYSSDGQHIAESEFRDHLEHVVLPYSQASAYSYNGQEYLTGSLARLNLNKDQLHARTRLEIGDVLTLFPSTNVYLNNVAQTIEVLHCIDESIDLLKTAHFVKEDRVKPTRESGTGVGVIDAPRGLLFYKLVVENKIVKDGQVVVPTGQNQMNITKDIGNYVQNNLDVDRKELEFKIEELIRAYDPCMSCASHFLKVKWDVA